MFRMDDADREKLIAGWICFAQTEENAAEYHARFWAYKALEQLRETDPLACLEIVVAIMERDPSDDVISNLAAGPVEEMLVVQGIATIDRIEQLAATNPGFKRLLGGVWDRSIPEPIKTRFNRTRGGERW
jgi:hypothetical protein